MKMPNARRVTAWTAGLSLAWLACGEALAIKIVCKVTPNNAVSAGFAISAGPERQDGTVTLTISRDLSKAKSFPPDSDLTISRTAVLRVFGDAGLLVKCRLEPRTEKNILKYHVSLARDHLKHAHLTISEVDDLKDIEGRAPLIGGGMIYEIALNSFATTR